MQRRTIPVPPVCDIQPTPVRGRLESIRLTLCGRTRAFLFPENFIHAGNGFIDRPLSIIRTFPFRPIQPALPEYFVDDLKIATEIENDFVTEAQIRGAVIIIVLGYVAPFPQPCEHVIAQCNLQAISDINSLFDFIPGLRFRLMITPTVRRRLSYLAIQVLKVVGFDSVADGIPRHCEETSP